MTQHFEQVGSITPTQDTRLGRMLSGGRLTATMLSKRTQQHVTLTMESMAKVKGKWDHVPYSEASHVFVKMGQGGYGSTKLATYYPKSGKLYWDTRDKAWRYAVMETLRAAVTGQQETAVYAITEASRCGVCGLELTNAKSIELGIGPTCEEKYTGGSTGRTVHYQRDEANLVEDLKPRIDRKGRNLPRTFEALAAAVNG